MTTDDWGDARGAVTDTSPPRDMTGTDVGIGSGPARPLDPGHAARLRQTIETEIVPRLLAARGRLGLPRSAEGELDRDTRGAERRVVPADCAELQRLLLAHDSSVARAYVAALVNQGVLREQIYVDLLAPVARGFGQLWEDDAADFTQITVALGRLQVLLHELGRDGANTEDSSGAEARSVLLITMPGEQHSFGLLVIGDAFRRHGWNVCCEFPRTSREALELVASHHFDLLGLSSAGEVKAEDLGTLLPALRRASSNTAMPILVGGPLFMRCPELVEQLGADGTAMDGEGAVEIAEQLVSVRVELN
jgi:methanogenic corrinoid protein MtbC1